MVVMLVTTAIALASAGAALMYTDLRDNRAAWAEDLRTEAAILAPDGSLFASYSRADQPDPPARRPKLPGETGLYIDGERVLVLKAVLQGSEMLGTIYLRAQYDLSGRIRAYLNVLGAVMIVGLIAALLASSWLHRVVTRPMES